jgi:hypothetical protein
MVPILQMRNWGLLLRPSVQDCTSVQRAQKLKNPLGESWLGVRDTISLWSCHREPSFCPRAWDTPAIERPTQPLLPGGQIGCEIVWHDSACACSAGYSQQAGAVWLNPERTSCLTNMLLVKALTGLPSTDGELWSLRCHGWLNWGAKGVHISWLLLWSNEC